MKLFIAFGSFGEIAPLLEIALQLKDRGEAVEFATTNDWAPQVRAYGLKVHTWTVKKHADGLEPFLRAHLLGRAKEFYALIQRIKPDAIISTFFCFSAQSYAEKHGIAYVPTTTSPYYFMQTDPVPVFRECMSEQLAMRKELGLGDPKSYMIVGIYPWYLHEDVGVYPVGFPELRPRLSLSAQVAEFIKQPYGVITRGTLVGRGELDRMVNAIKAHGLRCLYLGPHQCDADMIAYLDNHKEAVKHAQVAITHAGIGTTIDCMGLPMIVEPVAYDQFYNAQRLIDLKCAIRSTGSYIKAIEQANKPRSFLPNDFYLDEFLEILNANTPGHARRHAANVGERPQVH